MKSIQLFAKWVAKTVAPTLAQNIIGRIAIVYDRRPAATFPAYADIFNSYDQTGAQTQIAWTPPNPNNTDRFILVRDCKFYFSTNDFASTNTLANFMMNNTFVNGSECNFYKKLNGLETQFISTANPVTISNIGTGALYCIVVTNNAVANDAPGNFEFTWRLRYYDY